MEHGNYVQSGEWLVGMHSDKLHSISSVLCSISSELHSIRNEHRSLSNEMTMAQANSTRIVE